jgi:hypothetical protein
MMILKTNRLKLGLAAVLIMAAARVHALDTFECVRDLIPVSEQAAFQSKRKGFEKPFMVSERFMVFPEVNKDSVIGFFIYNAGHAWHYDSVEKSDGSLQPVLELKRDEPNTLLNLIAQPEGLETVTLQYMPSYGNTDTTQGGPVILGSSLLPVVGAFVSRPSEKLRTIFHNPKIVDESDLKQWIYDHSSRKPAAVKDIAVEHKIMHLASNKVLPESRLWEPLNSELKLRKHWVQEHNLNEATFKQFSHAMETTCK